MKTFDIFRDASGKTEAVKQGWSWPAFFFVSFWAMAKQLWVVALVTFPLLVLVYVIAGGSAQPQDASSLRVSDWMSVIWIVTKVIAGAMGNQWRVKRLKSLGFNVAGTVSAPDSQRAIALQTTQA